MIRKIATITCVLLLTVGCSPGPMEVSQTANGSVVVSNASGEATVSLVTLEDKTRCAVLVGFRKGGIDCHWKGQDDER